ncbi:MAG: hypothetical protein ACRD8U_14295, partial [Pyrinomonadaceae bacterium]
KKEIWLGPLLGNNRSRLIERCAGLVSEGKADSFLYLAASHPLLEIITESILDGRNNRGVWGELPGYLFRGFVRRVIRSAVDDLTGLGLPPRTPIDHDELPLKRSLISQILARLKADGKLKAIAPLAHSDGCVNTMAALIGEIQRAGKTSADFQESVAARAAEQGTPKTNGNSPGTFVQTDFDQEVALVYATYAHLIKENNLTEGDADGLRALAILGGQLEGRAMSLPWLENADLLILDGFFDFTPVQGEMLRRLIPRFPEVIVNLNKDPDNPEIFKPFENTISRLSAIADFEIRQSNEKLETLGALSSLRQKLFNPSPPVQLRNEFDEEKTGTAQTEV